MEQCREDGLPPEDYEGVAYPHPYLLIWIECKRYGDPATGTPALPEPQMGVLGQDADLMLAFEVLEEAQEMKAEEERIRRKVKQAAAAQDFVLG